jgi:serralysin
MSYFETSENPNTNATPAELLSTMMVDIIAIQEIYGAPGSNGVTAGNTVWGADTNLTGLWSYIDSAILTNDRIPGVYSGTDMALTIYDQGGTDLLNLSTSITNDRVNMNDATFSDVGGIIGNLGIARDTVIENLEAGRGNDDITGNAAANIINGNSGNDTINSGGGDDTVRGGNGTDRLWGGDGNDLIFGQAGHDVIGGMDGADTIWGGTGNDTIWGGGWNDTIGGAQGNDSLMGDNGDDLFWGGDGNDTIEGGAHNDTLRGGSNNDLLRGGDGDDLVDGGWGWDRAFGDDGDDLVTGHYGNDLGSGGNGNDTVHGGAGDDTVWGDDGNDFVQGGAGNDIVLGGEGSDTILGGWGNDTLSGNSGADVFVFGYLDPGWDVITDFSAADGDVLRLDDILWRDTHGVLGKAAVLSTFSSVVNGALTFTFDMDEVLALNGVTTLSGNAFEIF